eukprot:gene22071-28570_t
MYERKKVSSSSSSFAKGNLSNQKYEALWNIKHHFQTVVNASPSRETSRWKQSDDFQVIKHQGKRQLLDKNVEKSNLELTQRMFNVLTEERATRTKEYVPGYRVGRGGTVIDCYESSCQRFYEYKVETKRKVRVIREQKIYHDNTFIAKYIDAARSSCDRKELKRSYDENRVLYNFLASRTPHTALHLGLLQKAKFEFYQGSVRKISSSTSRPLSSSVPNNRTTSEILLQGASIEDASIVNDLDDLPLKHVNSKLELNTSRKGYFAHKLQPMFAECARYATLSGPTTKEHPSNPVRKAKNDTTLDNSSEIIDAELPDYITDGGPVQGLRKLQALRQQREMQQQSPYGIIQEESQTLSHWSDLCAEVDAEMISREDRQIREPQEADDRDTLDKQSLLTPPLDEYAAMEQLTPELVEELGPELSILYGALFARKAALEQQHQDYEDREIEDDQQEEEQQEDITYERELYDGQGEDTKEEQENENTEYKSGSIEVIPADSESLTLGIADDEDLLQEQQSIAFKKHSLAGPYSRSGRRAAIALVSVNTPQDSRFLFEGKNSVVEMSINHSMDSISYSYHVRGFMSDGEPYFLRDERNEIDEFDDEVTPTDSGADNNRRTWISMNMKRGASIWTSLV